MSVNPQTSRMLNIVQMVSEVGIGAGYVLGLIPFVYLWSSGWVIPLTFVSLIISIVNRNNTTAFTIANVIFAFLSFIPLLGYVTRILGILVSLINLFMLKSKIN